MVTTTKISTPTATKTLSQTMGSSLPAYGTAARTALATAAGITSGYTGTAAQNAQIVASMNKGTTGSSGGSSANPVGTVAQQMAAGNVYNTQTGEKLNYGSVTPTTPTTPNTYKIPTSIIDASGNIVNFPTNTKADNTLATNAITNADAFAKNTTLAQQAEMERQNTMDIQNQKIADEKRLFEAMPTGAEIYNKALQDSGKIEAQKLVSSLTGQLNTIVAQGQANQMSVVGQGRGIPEVIIGGQQAQFARETAIQALPVQAQLSAAQGNLEMATENLNTLHKIQSEDANRAYTYKTKVIDTFYDFADKQSQAKLADIKTQQGYEHEELLSNIKYQRDLSIKAYENGEGNIGAKISKLDPASPTYKEDLSKLQGSMTNPKLKADMEYQNSMRIKNLADAAKNDIKDGTLTELQLKQIDTSPQGKKLVSLSGLYKKADTYKNLVSTLGFKAAGDDKAKLDAAYADLKIAYKEAANLGALTSPDVGIIEDAIKPSSGALNYLTYQLAGGQGGVTGAIDQALKNAKLEALQNYKQLTARNSEYSKSDYVNQLITPFARDYGTVNLDNVEAGEIIQTEDGVLLESLGGGKFSPL